jgi:hypothetical protein
MWDLTETSKIDEYFPVVLALHTSEMPQIFIP